MRCKLFIAAVLLASLSIACGSAQAGTIWDAGGGATTDINLNTNWDGDVVNALNGTTTATFATAGSTATINVNASFTDIAFNRDANFTIANGAGSLTVGTSGIAAAIPIATSRTYAISESSLILGGNQTWTTTNNGAGVTSLTVSSLIGDGGNGYKITKSGDGTLSLTSASSTFSGGVELSTGTLAIQNTTTTNTGPIVGPLGAGTLTLAGGTLRMGTVNNQNAALRNNLSVTGAVTINKLDTAGFDTWFYGTLTGGSSTSLTFTGTSGSARMYTDASNFLGTINYNSTNSSTVVWLKSGFGNYSQATFNLTGTGTQFVRLESNSQMGALQGAGGRISTDGFTLQVGALNTITTFGGVIQSTGGLTKVGTVKLTLTGANLYTGLTKVLDGTLAIGTSNERISNSSALEVDGGAFDVNSLTETMAAVTLKNGSITGTTGLLTGSSYNMQNGSVTARLGGSGIVLNKTTAGTVTLSGANTYTGLTTVSAGTLAYGASNVISTGGLTVDGGTAVLSLLGFSDSVGTVTLDNVGQITSSTGILTSTGTFEMKSGSVSARLAGAVPLNKTTAGTVTLSGANTYTGATLISAGELNVTGDISSSSLTTLSAGATLSGTGTVGALTVTGATLAPGSTPGTMNSAGNVIWLDHTFEFEIDNATGVVGVDWDLLNITADGDLDLTGLTAGGLLLELYSQDTTMTDTPGALLNWNPSLNYAWTFARVDFDDNQNDDAIIGFNPGDFSFDLTNFTNNNTVTGTFSVQLNGEELQIVYTAPITAIPEPGTFALAALGLTGLGLLAWRRRRMVD